MKIEFPFPDIKNPMYISNKIVIDNGEIVGAGFVRLTSEGILILDKERSKIVRAKAAVSIVEGLKDSVKKFGLDECHVFVQDVNVQRFLGKLGFVNCKGGQPMVIHF